MLFNSYEFIFLFMPATLLVYLLLKGRDPAVALIWLIVASLFFYTWWRPFNLVILCTSIAVNYVLALRIIADTPQKSLWLAAGVVFNLCLLGYFKYLVFFQTVSNDIFGTEFVLQYIILPLGVSFITFQKIAFLLDVASGKVDRVNFREFALFVLYFPQLIAGPIVHFREMMPQYRSLTKGVDKALLAAGLTLFLIGCFKKVVIADGLAGYVSPIYASASTGETLSLLMAWIAGIGFTLQIYFDFSGYSEMAAGLALAMGLRLPTNFDSPLKARNIVDFWARWHMTLTGFLTAYVYNPLVMYNTRRRISRKLPLHSPGRPNAQGFLMSLAIPSVLTMLLSGLWHGAGYTYLIWGFLHGIYLAANHAWRAWQPSYQSSWLTELTAWAFTFVSVVTAMVWFRSPDVQTAIQVLSGMVGINGLALPAQFQSILPFEWIAIEAISLTHFVELGALLAVALFIALFSPNALQIMGSYKPTLDFHSKDEFSDRLAARLAWNPSVLWGLVLGIMGITVVFSLDGPSEFLYWQF